MTYVYFDAVVGRGLTDISRMSSINVEFHHQQLIATSKLVSNVIGQLKGCLIIMYVCTCSFLSCR